MTVQLEGYVYDVCNISVLIEYTESGREREREREWDFQTVPNADCTNAFATFFSETRKTFTHKLCIEHKRKSDMFYICSCVYVCICCIISNLFDNKQTVFLLPMGINLILFVSLRLYSLVHLQRVFSILCPLLFLFAHEFFHHLFFFILSESKHIVYLLYEFFFRSLQNSRSFWFDSFQNSLIFAPFAWKNEK